MAQPIPLEIPPRDPRQELFTRLQNAPMKHAQALLSGYEAIQSLHDAGIFDLVIGATGSGSKITSDLVKEVDTPESIRAIRNLVILLKTMGSIDPEILNALTGAAPGALEEGKKKEEPPGLFSLLLKFRSTHFRRGLSMIHTFLEGFGRNLSAEKQSGKKENEHNTSE